MLPGTGMAALGEALVAEGLTLANLGDVDDQTIVVAVGTAAHGSGGPVGNLSSMFPSGDR